MKEVRTKGIGGKRIEKTVALADRMRATVTHAVEQQKQNSEDSPNSYADTTAREGFDRITHEAGHLVVSTAQSAYQLSVKQYQRQQVKKQAETHSEIAPSSFEAGKQYTQQTAIERKVEKRPPPVQEHIRFQVEETTPVSESVRSPRVCAERGAEDSGAQNVSGDSLGRNLAQRQAQEQIAAKAGREKEGIVIQRYAENSPHSSIPDSPRSVRTKEPFAPDTKAVRAGLQQDTSASPVEAGRTLAKKTAQKRLLLEQEKKAASITVSMERDLPVLQPDSTKKSVVLSKEIFQPRKSVDAPIQGTPISKTATASKKTAETEGKVFRKKVTKEVNNSVRTVNRSVKGTDIASKKMIRTAKKQLAKAKQEERIKVATRTVASVAKKTGSIFSKAAKAIAEFVKELVAALAAGGSMALMIVVILVVIGAAGLMLASDENDSEILPVSEEVKAYEPLIRQYAKQHGIGDYVLLIEAVMMQESGGRGTDPMQCSECNFNTRYPHAPGSITDPEYSIDVGIQNLADCLSIAGSESPVDIDRIKLAIQGYNYGQGYITWALSKYGEYTKANAVEFSMKTAEQVGWNSYGDMDYVPHVLRYYPLGQLFYDPDGSAIIVEVAGSQIGNVGGDPYWSWYGFSNHVEWCACFVSWCADQCGYLDAGVMPKFCSCVLGVNWFKERGQWQRNSYEPSPGDIIFFDWNKPGVGQDGIADHVGIVQKVENGRIFTIEGNSNDMCKERSYTIGNSQIQGYGVLAP